MRLNRGAWFPLAARLLTDHGPGALTIERLCAEAGVTKGSFYHHFTDITGFRVAFVHYLYDRGGGSVIDRLATIEPAAARLEALIEAIAAEDTALDGAVRRWAATSDDVAEQVRLVDARRHELVAAIFAALSPTDPQLAADLTRLSEAFYLGATLLDPPISGDEYRRLAGLLSRIPRTPREEEPA